MQTRGGTQFTWPRLGCLTVALLCAPQVVYGGASPGKELTRESVPGRIERPAGGDALYAGEMIEVRWTALPDAVNECELLLSLDGGRDFTVRLTPRLDRTTRELSWRVPNLPTRQARLRLRVGVAGREIESSMSSGFTIVGASTSPLAPVRLAHGEWWTATIPGASLAEIPMRRPLFGPVQEHPGEAFLALLPEEPVPVAPGTGMAVLRRPHLRRARVAVRVSHLPSRSAAPPQRE